MSKTCDFFKFILDLKGFGRVWLSNRSKIYVFAFVRIPASLIAILVAVLPRQLT